ncbi:hypothetical protein GCM10010992_13780 [Cloacibacterium rupense]|uniref:Uncharacterized protein n=1 Tax=Cloacibacterium rupense TaxID=517423 RepID=A0ABQ2NKT1_9FLAO|nr:hypothetical protein [Cloacibacterium rupense]GGP03841.1 hypothetical protein GCM10010992_13780 [Cloacibacterium rupense]
MGTSSMYGGYSDGGSQNNPLIPPDFEDNDQEDNNSQSQNEDSEQDLEDNRAEQQEGQTVEWSNAKTFMSNLASGRSSNIKGAVSKYVKAYGGAKSASKNAVGGIKTTINLGNFVKSISEQGLKETLDEYKINYRDKSTKEILNELVNILAPSPNTKEDAISRKALILTMEVLYKLIEKENLEVEVIEKLDVNIIIPTYIEVYIYQKLINDLGSRIESNSKSAADAVAIEKDIKEYIHNKIEIVFKGKEIKDYKFSTKEILSLYNQCYTVIEDLL